MTRLIYASGHIAAADYERATSWYQEAMDLLNGPRQPNPRPLFNLIRPMRGKEFLFNIEGPLGYAGYPAPTRLSAELTSQRGITARDRNDVLRCDAVLMNLLGAPDKVSIGCAIEAGWADIARKPLVIVRQRDNAMAGHPILEGVAAYSVETLEEGCALVRLLLGA